LVDASPSADYGCGKAIVRGQDGHAVEGGDARHDYGVRI
jgi:hypothetical protein